MNTAELADLYTEHLEHLGAGYAQALATCGYDAAVIHSGTARKKSEFDDQYWPLRVTPHFQHWLPLATPECALVIAPGKRPRLIWNVEVSFWEKPAPVASQHWQAALDIEEVDTLDGVRAGRKRRGCVSGRILS